jgi:hypothetical protein
MKSLLALTLISAAAVTARSEQPATFLSSVTANLSAWDGDHDQKLSLAEIDRAIASADVRGEVAASAVALRRGTLGRTAVVSLDEIKARIEAHHKDPKAKPDYEDLHQWALARIQKANRTLFVTRPPQVSSVRQGKLGDCFCLAALRTVLQRDAMAIVEMIQPQTDGSYRVKVGSQVIAVPPLTDGEIALGASTSDGLWPLVYEKAVGISRMKPDAKDATPFNVVTKGGSAGSMMSALTGNEIKRWSCKTWRDEKDDVKKAALLDDVRQQFTSAFADNRLVTGGTAALAKGKKGPPGILFNHGYAVLGYDSVKDEVHLWNPHGDAFKTKGEPGLSNGWPMEKGEFRVPLKELVTFFGGFAFEQRK